MQQTHSEQPSDMRLEDVPSESPPTDTRPRVIIGNYWATLTLIAFVTGLGGGYLLGNRGQSGKESIGASTSESQISSLAKQINPPEGYSFNVKFGDIGPKLLDADAINYNAFVQVYQKAGQPLNEEQLAILTEGSDASVVIDQQNAYFLLNLFWALGLTNQNPVLTEGPMMRQGRDQVVRYASTGGWTLAERPISEIYASTPIVSITPEQQARLEEVAMQVYRPCCDNPTHFPDCNHGMAMLGLLELMASQDASTDEMFEAAKYANAYWYPKQSLELAIYFKAKQKVDFTQIDSRQLVSKSHSSLTGYRNVHQWLSTNGELPEVPGGGSSCGV